MASRAPSLTIGSMSRPMLKVPARLATTAQAISFVCAIEPTIPAGHSGAPDISRPTLHNRPVAIATPLQRGGARQKANLTLPNGTANRGWQELI